MTRVMVIAKLKALLNSRAVMLVLKGIQIAVVGVVLYILANKLGEIGWVEVRQALPTNPLFYLFFTLMYFALPIGEWLVYQTLWGSTVRQHFGTFVRMRVYNLALVSYAGEAFLAMWAHKKLCLKGRVAAAAVKDSNILSALASNSFTLLLLASFFLTGQLEQITNAEPDYGFYIGLSVALGLVLIPVVLRFQGRILAIDTATTKRVFSIHLIRLTIVMLLQAAQWETALPTVPFETWLLLLTAQMVLTRVPFLPNTDLLFMGLGISMIGYIEGPETAIAGMFLASGALSQVYNLCAFVVTSIPSRKQHADASVSSTSV